LSFRPNYPVAPPHIYMKPWLEPPQPKNDTSPGGFTFNFTVGTAARQIFLDGHSYPCKEIEIVAPDADFPPANTETIFYAMGPGPSVLSGAFELAPGSAKTVHVNDVNKLWLIAQNTADRVFGQVEA